MALSCLLRINSSASSHTELGVKRFRLSASSRFRFSYSFLQLYGLQDLGLACTQDSIFIIFRLPLETTRPPTLEVDGVLYLLALRKELLEPEGGPDKRTFLP